MSESTRDATKDPTVRGRRAFVVIWMALSVAGALDHTIAERLFGRRFDLLLPHLKFGHVMFNRHPHQITVYEYGRPDGSRAPLDELVHDSSFGYSAPRFPIRVLAAQDYVKEICYRATRGSTQFIPFFIDEYDMDVSPRRPVNVVTLRCTPHGLLNTP